MHDYGILKREGISIDNSVIKGNTDNPYDREFINSISKYVQTWKLQGVVNGVFLEGVHYTMKKNKFIPLEYIYKKPRVLLVANNFLSYFPQYTVVNNGNEYLIRGTNLSSGQELCIIHESILTVYQDTGLTITRTMNLDNNMTATFVIISKNNQQIVLGESL
mgnify:FL=1